MKSNYRPGSKEAQKSQKAENEGESPGVRSRVEEWLIDRSSEEMAASHPCGDMILKDRPSIKMADLELIRYSDKQPKGQCS